MKKKEQTRGVEERVQRRAKRNQIRNAILLSAYGAVGVSMIIMAPNAVRLLKYVGKIVGPSPRLKRRVSQKYSELIKQGIFKRVNSESGSRIELTEKGKRLAEQLAQTEELRPKKQKKWDRKWRLVFYDIFDQKKITRDRFRRILKGAGFYPLQKSVYLHAYPCEPEIDFLKNFLGIGAEVRIVIAEKIENDDKFRDYFGLP